VKSSIRGRDGNCLTSLTPPHFCACPKPGLGFPMPYVVVFYVLYCLRCDVAVRFVDIGGILDPSLFKLSFHKFGVGGTFQ